MPFHWRVPSPSTALLFIIQMGQIFNLDFPMNALLSHMIIKIHLSAVNGPL